MLAAGGDRAGSVRAVKRAKLVGAVLVLALIGVAVPVLVLVVNASSQSRVAPGGIKLTAAQEDGRQLFARNCSTCHTLASSNAVGKVGYNLDEHLGPIQDRRAVALLVRDAIANGRARGRGQMPRNLLQGADAADVASFISRTAGRG